MGQQRALKSAYDTIMGLQPDQFELRPSGVKLDRAAHPQKAGRGESSKELAGTRAAGSDLALLNAAPTSWPFLRP